MREIFDYTISDEKEKIPIGYVKSLYNDEIIEHYSEQSMLKDYKNIVNNEGINSARYKIYKTDIKPRHGLRYELLKEEAGEYGEEYSKEEYEKDYSKCLEKSNNKKQR